jgi:hypothetical protein
MASMIAESRGRVSACAVSSGRTPPPPEPLPAPAPAPGPGVGEALLPLAPGLLMPEWFTRLLQVSVICTWEKGMRAV